MIPNKMAYISRVPQFAVAVCLTLALTFSTSVTSDEATSPPAANCFKNAAIFEEYFVYIQPLSMETRLSYYPGHNYDDVMVAKSDTSSSSKYIDRAYTCLKDYGDNRMMVGVRENGGSGREKFQCLQFELLDKFVVRMSKTKLRGLRKKVNCHKDKYHPDQALLVSLDGIKPKPCPLHGGFQMMPYQGETVPSGQCIHTYQTYNPSIRYQCDSTHAVVDFGYHCEPPILRQFKKMNGRHIEHLHCVASWDETSDIKAVLFRMRDQPNDVWCTHLKQRNGSSEIMSFFVSIDGRCAKGAFHDEAFPSKTSLFGYVAQFVAPDDRRCSDETHIAKCMKSTVDCSSNTECPSRCNRCIKPADKNPCEFMGDVVGNWKSYNSMRELDIEVTNHTLYVKKYGQFACHEPASEDVPGNVYQVVQAGASSTCMPYHACVNLDNQLPGIIDFRLFPAWKDEEDGSIWSCKKTMDKIKDIAPPKDEQTITILDPEKLVRSSCGFQTESFFPSGENPSCMLRVEECGNDCDSLFVNYDNETCTDETEFGLVLENDHTCFGTWSFDEFTTVLLTYSEYANRYYCWVYTSDELIIVSPGDCNSNKLRDVLMNEDRLEKYDPVRALLKPMSGVEGTDLPVTGIPGSEEDKNGNDDEDDDDDNDDDEDALSIGGTSRSTDKDATDFGTKLEINLVLVLSSALVTGFVTMT